MAPSVSRSLLQASEQTRRDLTNRLESALRNVATQGALVKREQEEAQRRLADARRRFDLDEARVADEERMRRRQLEFINLYNRARYEAAMAQAWAMQQDSIAAGQVPTQAAVDDYRAMLGADNTLLKSFNATCLARGVLKGHSKIYVSLAHTDADVERTLGVFREALAALPATRRTR